MTGREKLLETLKVAYEPRKISQYDGSVTLFYPTDEDVADMIEAAVIDEYKHRAEVAERALKICLIDNLHCYECDMGFDGKCKETDKEKEECAMIEAGYYTEQAKKELAEEGK